jgi:hypothetical protein
VSNPLSVIEQIIPAAATSDSRGIPKSDEP